MPKSSLNPNKSVGKLNVNDEKNIKKIADNTLPYNSVTQLAITSLAISNAADAILHDGGNKLGLSGLAILFTLEAQPTPISMGRLSVLLGLTRQQMQKQVDNLQGEGLLLFMSSEEGKRVKNLSLTEAGHKAILLTATLLRQHLDKSSFFNEIENTLSFQRRLTRIAISLARLIQPETKR